MPRLLAAALCLLLPLATPAAERYRVETVAQGLAHPWSLAFLPDGTALVTERPGRLRVIERGTLRAAPVAGLPPVYAGGQAGLFDVVPDPDFARSRWLFLSHAQGSAGANRLRVLRARFDGQALHEVTTLFDAEPAKRGDAHFGGRIAFLPDATLLVGVGEGFSEREQAQRLDNHLGKFVRVARDGSVPSDNPFVGRPGVRPELYSYGHRNPQAVLYDAQRGVIYAHEHGPRGGDELNRLRAGANYGWPLATHGLDYTGARVTPFTTYPGTQPPLLHWTPSIAPAGMALYRGAAFPAWQDSLFVAALVERAVRRVALRPDGTPDAQEVLFAELGERLRDVREAPDGTLWLLTDAADGRVLRVVPAAAAAAR
jgi:glucose/arabinose dehydrogenase